MTFFDASAGRVLVNERHLSLNLDSWEFAVDRELDDVTTILDTGHRFIPGIRMGAIGVTGFYTNTAGELYDEVSTTIGVDNGLLWTICPTGFTLGQPALLAQSELADLTLTSKVGTAVAMKVGGKPDDGTDLGVQLHPLGAETVDVNGTGVDNLAATANGGVGMLHVTAYTIATNAVIRVQHSTDNSVWNDLVAATTVTAIGSQRLTVAAGTTVSRYLRSLLDVTGAGSITFQLSFARR